MKSWRTPLACLVALLAVLAGASAAFAQRESRVALVVGNGAYENIGGLKNPVNDARAMAKVLTEAGFEVILRENVTRRSMTGALAEFAGKLSPGGVGLFFYAGHGMQYRGANFLLPVDAKLTTELDIKFETLDLAEVLHLLDDARVRLSLLILDACRDEPTFRRFRSSTRGLAQMDAPRGTVIAYATAPGEAAADGDGDNGLYTSQLLRAITAPGARLEDILKQTIDGVARASGNRQTPWVNSSFRGEFYFFPASTSQPPATAAPAIDPAEIAGWNAVVGSNNPAMYEAFLQRFPNGMYSGIARVKLAELLAAARTPSSSEEFAFYDTIPVSDPRNPAWCTDGNVGLVVDGSQVRYGDIVGVLGPDRSFLLTDGETRFSGNLSSRTFEFQVTHGAGVCRYTGTLKR